MPPVFDVEYSSGHRNWYSSDFFTTLRQQTLVADLQWEEVTFDSETSLMKTMTTRLAQKKHGESTN